MVRPTILLNLRHIIVRIQSEVLNIFTDDISAGGLLILAFIIRPVVSSSVPTSFIRNLMKQAYMTLSDLILTHLCMPYLPLKEIKSIWFSNNQVFSVPGECYFTNINISIARYSFRNLTILCKYMHKISVYVMHLVICLRQYIYLSCNQYICCTNMLYE